MNKLPANWGSNGFQKGNKYQLLGNKPKDPIIYLLRELLNSESNIYRISWDKIQEKKRGRYVVKDVPLIEIMALQVLFMVMHKSDKISLKAIKFILDKVIGKPRRKHLLKGVEGIEPAKHIAIGKQFICPQCQAKEVQYFEQFLDTKGQPLSSDELTYLQQIVSESIEKPSNALKGKSNHQNQ